MQTETLKEELFAELKDHKGKDNTLKTGFFDRRVDKFAKSIDGRWVYTLKDDDDDEPNWYFLDEMEYDIQSLLSLAIDRTIEACKGAVPEAETTQKGKIESAWKVGFNSCRTQTLTNLEKLKV